MIDEIFNKIEDDINIIKSSEVIRRQFQQLKDYLYRQKITLIHQFNQVKKNTQFEGLVSETMFFDDKIIYDIVVGTENIEVNFVLLEYVSKLQFATNPIYTSDKTADGEKIKKVDYTSRFIISYQEIMLL